LAEDRAIAQETIARLLSVDLDTAEIIEGESGERRSLDKGDFELLAYLTSALRADGRSEDALAVCHSFARAYPNRATVLRLLGRAQEWCGDLATGAETMRQALRQLDVDDTTAVWLGNTFHNCGRHVDAIEVYLISCWIDPDDASWFAYCANELSFALCEPFSLYDAYSPVVRGDPARTLSSDVTAETVAAFVTFALSTLSQTGGDMSRIEDALRRTELSNRIPELQTNAQLTTRADRRAGIWGLYSVVRSDLTNECPERVRPVAPNTNPPVQG
jgi:tetratricopeptide (TPR) repeat protein